jgi:hypothetical protein
MKSKKIWLSIVDSGAKIQKRVPEERQSVATDNVPTTGANC